MASSPPGTKAKKMTLAAKGAIESPGRSVHRKAGANTSISAKPWDMSRQRLGHSALRTETTAPNPAFPGVHANGRGEPQEPSLLAPLPQIRRSRRSQRQLPPKMAAKNVERCHMDGNNRPQRPEEASATRPGCRPARDPPPSWEKRISGVTNHKELPLFDPIIGGTVGLKVVATPIGNIALATFTSRVARPSDLL